MNMYCCALLDFKNYIDAGSFMERVFTSQIHVGGPDKY